MRNWRGGGHGAAAPPGRQGWKGWLAAGASHQASGDAAVLVSYRLPAGFHRFMSASEAHAGEAQQLAAQLS